MAETIHLTLVANGKQIKGESTQLSLGRAETIECLSFAHEMITAREASSGIASGRRQILPLSIWKRIDASSPLLFKALSENHAVDCTFRFFRPCQRGSGDTEQFFTVEMRGGRINSIKQKSDSVVRPAEASVPPLEEVTFVAPSLAWTFMPTGTPGKVTNKFFSSAVDARRPAASHLRGSQRESVRCDHAFDR
jgi:type VI secretion system secreted protein Hcp